MHYKDFSATRINSDKISESSLLINLGLSAKFPRTLLCSRKIVLEVWMLKALTTVAMLVVKLHLRHKRFEDRISRLISINAENAQIQHRCKESVIETLRKFEINNRT